MQLPSIPRAPWPAWALLALLAGACSDEPEGPTQAPPPLSADLALAVEASDLDARPGDRIGIAIRADHEGALLGLQGALRYDPAALRFLGQEPGDKASLAMVNAEFADRGVLPYLVMNSRDGYGERSPVLVFEVLRARYDAGLRFQLSEAVFRGGRDGAFEVAAAEVRPVREAPLVLPGSPRHLSPEDWARVMDPGISQVELDFGRTGEGVSLSPGQRPSSGGTYGDVNLSGTYSSLDVALSANASLGRLTFELIAGTDSATGNNRDFVIAANVRPVGPPVGGADPNRVLNATDIQALQATFLGGTDVAGVVKSPIRAADAAGCSNVVVNLNITADATWNVPRPCWIQLEGRISVTNGATLTIAPGTLVRGVNNPVSALYVERDGRIVAIGTAADPIEFGCIGAQTPGCWAGVFIAGNATVNELGSGLSTSPAIPGRQTGGANQRQGEGLGPLYGGNNDADSSGVLRYVRIEFAGNEVAPNDELNCLTLGGVGSGTDIDHVQCHKGADDGVELFGGTVDLSYLVLSDQLDDAFDISYGWRGRAQYVIVQQRTAGAFVSNNGPDKGLEADNTENSATYNNSPRTTPRLYNFTLVRGGTAPVNREAMHIRRGVGPEIGHWYVAGYSGVLRLDDAATCGVLARDVAGAFTTDSLLIRRSLLANNGTLGRVSGGTFNAACAPFASDADVLSAAQFQNTVSPALTTALIDPLSGNPDFRHNPASGAATMSTPVGSSLPPEAFFNTAGAAHVGALGNTPASQNSIPWYAGWTRFP